MNFEFRANLVVRKVAKVGAYDDGDAAVSSSRHAHMATSATSSVSLVPPPAAGILRDRPTKPDKPKKERVRQVSQWLGGITTSPANRCVNFNHGKCQNAVAGPCPVKPSLLHACLKCGGQYSWGLCPQAKRSDNDAIGWQDNKSNGSWKNW